MRQIVSNADLIEETGLSTVPSPNVNKSCHLNNKSSVSPPVHMATLSFLFDQRDLMLISLHLDMHGRILLSATRRPSSPKSKACGDFSSVVA